MPNANAQALGRLGAGHPKTYSAAERERRRQRLIQMNKTRRRGKRRAPVDMGKPVAKRAGGGVAVKQAANVGGAIGQKIGEKVLKVIGLKK